jgi:hypothetical protein
LYNYLQFDTVNTPEVSEIHIGKGPGTSPTWFLNQTFIAVGDKMNKMSRIFVTEIFRPARESKMSTPRLQIRRFLNAGVGAYFYENYLTRKSSL